VLSGYVHILPIQHCLNKHLLYSCLRRIPEWKGDSYIGAQTIFGSGSGWTKPVDIRPAQNSQGHFSQPPRSRMDVHRASSAAIIDFMLLTVKELSTLCSGTCVVVPVCINWFGNIDNGNSTLETLWHLIWNCDAGNEFVTLEWSSAFELLPIYQGHLNTGIVKIATVGFNSWLWVSKIYC